MKLPKIIASASSLFVLFVAGIVFAQWQGIRVPKRELKPATQAGPLQAKCELNVPAEIQGNYGVPLEISLPANCGWKVAGLPQLLSVVGNVIKGTPQEVGRRRVTITDSAGKTAKTVDFIIHEQFTIKAFDAVKAKPLTEIPFAFQSPSALMLTIDGRSTSDYTWETLRPSGTDAKPDTRLGVCELSKLSENELGELICSDPGSRTISKDGQLYVWIKPYSVHGTAEILLHATNEVGDEVTILIRATIGSGEDDDELKGTKPRKFKEAAEREDREHAKVDRIRVTMIVGRHGDIEGQGGPIDITFCDSPRFDGRCSKFTYQKMVAGPGDTFTIDLPMTHVPPMERRDADFFKIGLRCQQLYGSTQGCFRQRWLLQGLKAEVKMEGQDEYETVFLNPCANKPLDSEGEDKKFGINSTAFCAVTITASSEYSGTDDDVSLKFYDGGSSFSEYLGWKDYDDFEAGDKTSYGYDYFNVNRSGYTKYTITKSEDGDHGGWRLAEWWIYLFRPGSPEFINDHQCFRDHQDSPTWLEDDNLRWPAGDPKPLSWADCTALTKMDSSVGGRL